MFSDHQKKEFNNFIPGFTMGFVRATISHPFEILKLQSQMGFKQKYNISLYKGLHLSIISNSVERGIQFYYFDNFKKNHGLFISSLYSSLISTFITLPYNVVLLKKNILKTTYGIDKQIVLKSGLLEYNRNILGSTTFLYSYQTLKNYNIPFQISGIMSSIIVWLITYPIDKSPPSPFEGIFFIEKNNLAVGVIENKSMYIPQVAASTATATTTAIGGRRQTRSKQKNQRKRTLKW